MNIALFSDTYLPQINGVATHVKTLREGLMRLGHSILVVTPDTDAKAHYVEDGVLHCPAVALKRLYNYGMASAHSSERRQILDSYSFDVIHIHTEFGIGRCGMETAKRRGIPLIYTLHTMYETYLHYLVRQPLIPIMKKATREYIGYCASHANEVIGPSARVQDYLYACDVKKQVNIVPNAAELDYFTRGETDMEAVLSLRERYGFSPDDFVICFCGRLGKEKSVDDLISIYAECHSKNDHIKLMIVGNGPERPKLEEYAKRLGVSDCVAFTGEIPHESMREFYACCKIYATASKTEVNSVSMLEAMSMGLPVLQIMDKENPGQVIEDVNGFIFHTAEDFYGIVESLYNDAEKYSQLSASTSMSVCAAGQEALAQTVERVYLKGLAHQKILMDCNVANAKLNS